MQLQEALLKNYGISVESGLISGKNQMFQLGNSLFTIVYTDGVKPEELLERQRMSHHLLQQGDRYVSRFVLAAHQTYISEADDKTFILLENNFLAEPRNHKLGRKLAKFHNRARSLSHPIKECSRIGKWNEFWEQRIDQLEKVWQEKAQSHPGNEFEELFVDTFPYYMALGENAIQYLVDTEIDDDPSAQDAGTVCYDRFSDHTWSGSYCIKNPFDWVFDHGCRDISEWIRQHFFDNPHTFQPGIRKFLQEYQSVQSLSPFSFRLLYARLLFPIHYYEVIEELLLNPIEARRKLLEEKLQAFVDQSGHYQEFLRRFYETAEVPAKKLQIPSIDWL
ncbi:spore coat protein YutH [Peribacillus saganii]|uniref:Spore coat protein YutH n=1 Tax=Peribacillus saganii TaxID=2303992 RepID=A0A372LPS2_9BACI|nr:spore coat protein YutH [Peribacillus saganii]RFU70110.1 spore coat protein YutH [Peribacillus saganii]